MTTATWDLVVLGDHLGGLAAAALAARRGRRVLLLETQESGEPRPFEYLNAVSGGPEQEEALGRFFQEIGRSPFGPLGDDRIHFRTLDPPLQVCLDGHRLTCYAERTARTWELQREFGDAHRLLPALWQAEEQWRERVARALPQARPGGQSLPGRAFASVAGFVRLQALEREAARPAFPDWLPGLGLPAVLEAALRAQAEAVARRHAADLTWVEGLAALRAGQGGLFVNVSGQSGILAGLRAVFEAAGGETRPLVALEGIEAPRTGGVRLHLAAGGPMRADRALFDLRLEEALGLLPAESRALLERKGIGEREEQEYGLLELVLKADRRPEGMGDYLALAPPEAEAGAPSVLVASAPGWAADPDGRCGVEALCFFPVAAAAGGREHLLARVRSVVPFLDESLAAAPAYRTGTAARFARVRLDRGQREERLAAGRRTSIFHLAPFTFLRNGDYAAVDLASGILSGAIALA